MLWNREDAEDATQEILVRVVTQLSSFNFRSRLKTWTYRVAVNHLLDRKKSAVERMDLNFVRLSEDLAEGLASGKSSDKRTKFKSIRSTDRKSTRLNSSHRCISYAVFCLKKKIR